MGGAGHDLGGTAKRRDEIKKTALERAGVAFIEIPDRTTPEAIQRTIRELLARQQPNHLGPNTQPRPQKQAPKEPV